MMRKLKGRNYMTNQGCREYDNYLCDDVVEPMETAPQMVTSLWPGGVAPDPFLPLSNFHGYASTKREDRRFNDEG